jgi:hypothetical protein
MLRRPGATPISNRHAFARFRLLSCARVSRSWSIKCLLVLQEALKRVRLVS